MSFYSSFFLPEFLMIFVELFAFVWINVFLPFASPSLLDCSSTINFFYFFFVEPWIHFLVKVSYNLIPKWLFQLVGFQLRHFG